ncbi:uncharacterized protein LOC130958360 [Arachis stenosperma]|uniref:uncharacterized protein LOC130958360 n=1 Tax=Arachis stenosperma TaxID=217475 RepID=UPI0025AC8424|nr:uncharacterized protein LOC130958360 [Arachis stenosperma]
MKLFLSPLQLAFYTTSDSKWSAFCRPLLLCFLTADIYLILKKKLQAFTSGRVIHWSKSAGTFGAHREGYNRPINAWRKKNQRMANQIAKLTNVRIEHNNGHNEQLDDEENNSDSTHVFETQQPKKIQQNDDEDDLDNAVVPFTADVTSFKLPRNFILPLTFTPYDGVGDPKKHIKKL